MLEIKNLPDVEADNLIAERLVERILIHMIAISFTQNTSLSSLCIQFFQTFDIGFHSVPAILFDLESKGEILDAKHCTMLIDRLTDLFKI